MRWGCVGACSVRMGPDGLTRAAALSAPLHLPYANRIPPPPLPPPGPMPPAPRLTSQRRLGGSRRRLRSRGSTRRRLRDCLEMRMRRVAMPATSRSSRQFLRKVRGRRPGETRGEDERSNGRQRTPWGMSQRPQRSARAVQLFGLLAVLETQIS